MELGYLFVVLCQICEKRSANVHAGKTIILWGHSTRTERLLCEVCAGIETEQQWEAEQQELRAASKRQREQGSALIEELRKELLEPRLGLMTSNQIRIKGRGVDPHWKLAFWGLTSHLPEVDPLSVLFGPFQTLTNHLVQQVKDCELHVIRWHNDPEQLVNHVFEVFPQAGARLDLDKRLLFVEAERTLFSNPYRSLTFCQFAASLLGWGLPLTNRFRFQLAQM